MEHLNYSRQLTKYCKQMLEVPSIGAELRSVMSHVVDLHGASTKFLLPHGGRLFDDLQYRALDEAEPLRLPYPYIALEYNTSGKTRQEDSPIGYLNGAAQYEADSFIVAPKRIVFARERDDWIAITVAFWTQHDGTWRVLPECAIPTMHYLDRSQTIGHLGVPIQVKMMNESVPMSDYMDELGALLCFLNVLQCSNVHIERSAPKNEGKKIKAALPFDAYHTLTIDANKPATVSVGASHGHRSPREHLRRGHIRRLFDGRRIWVNAAVIGAGKGAGTIKKDYRLAA